MRGILGADVFINLLLVFIITTGLLLMNTNKATLTVDGAANERDMPATQLPQGSSQGSPVAGLRNTATLSARKNGDAIQYLLEDQPIELNDLVAELKQKKISSTRIRFDERIPYGAYVKVLDQCTRAGVKDIINVYQIKK